MLYMHIAVYALGAEEKRKVKAYLQMLMDFLSLFRKREFLRGRKNSHEWRDSPEEQQLHDYHVEDCGSASDELLRVRFGFSMIK